MERRRVGEKRCTPGWQKGQARFDDMHTTKRGAERCSSIFKSRAQHAHTRREPDPAHPPRTPPAGSPAA